MFWMGLIVFGLHFGILALDEFGFHRKRELSREELRDYSWDVSLVIAQLAFITFVPYQDYTKIAFGALTTFSIYWLTKHQLHHFQRYSARENRMHALGLIWHPVYLMTVVTMWPFIDGASFFVNLVLPFSTENLRPLCYGYGATLLAFTANRYAYWKSPSRHSSPLQLSHDSQNKHAA